MSVQQNLDTVAPHALNEKETSVVAPETAESDIEKSEGSIHKQEGVQAVEAITSVLTKKSLWITFALLYLCLLSDSFMMNTQYGLEPYVTSSFSQHGLLATTNVMSSIIGGVSKLTIAKIFDIWGRVEGFSVAIFLLLMGMLMKAVCQNVQTYAAAAVFYWVGHTGLGYSIDVFTSDLTSLRNRGIMFGLNATPGLATMFAGPAIAQEFLEHSTWRWAYGSFCIIVPVMALPVFISFYINGRKAKKLGVAPAKKSDRTLFESIKYHTIQFDVLGMLLTTAAFSLILLPLSLAGSQKNKWANGSMIAMEVVGFLCFVAFFVWEKWYAPVQYLPFKYLKDPTILGACVCHFAMYIAIYTWDIYLTSYLQVVNQVSIRDSGYILNSYSISAFVVMPITGLVIRYVTKPKWIALGAVPLIALGTGLLVPFRQPGVKVGYITMCQIFNGAAGGILSVVMPIMVMASVTHQEVAVVLALHSLFASIGSGVGVAISGALWTNLLPGKLAHYLPAELQSEAATIYGDITVQLGYEWGSPAREAIVQAYGEVQRLMVIAGAAFVPVIAISIIVWRNLDTRNLKQTKGTVF
ncbi:major facilitator superfamily domain-containing protein [Dendryphion nanum]|uniref:Major facilitator superfamily domain-containing protein n=1 Tax=Dendryphion nanum TaxID=256645 RepID=A0A9P9ICU5_9PLEO|nr:major facilitator superfamily domain-containing protein [Dendryphion nanum]